MTSNMTERRQADMSSLLEVNFDGQATPAPMLHFLLLISIAAGLMLV